MPDDDQPGKTGDQIPSNLGATGQKHYVSPKKSVEIPDEFVVLKTKGIDKELFEQALEWDGGEAHPDDPLKRRVKRDATGKTAVKLKTKDGGQEVDLMNVWVVWSDVVVQNGNGVYEVGDGWSQYKTPLTEQDGWLFKFQIRPGTIITDQDRPALDGEKQKPVPGKGKAHLLTAAMDGDSAQYKWDSSRQVKVTIRNPDLISKQLLDLHDSDTFWVNQPKALDVVEDYPVTAYEGNDDTLIPDEHSIPYVVSNAVALKHQIGEIACHDAPNIVFLDDWGQNNYTLEVDYEFREFARIELWDGNRNAGQYWFKISDYSEWNFKAKSKFKTPPGDWINNESSTGN